MSAPCIQLERLEKDLHELARFGRHPGGSGITRPGLTDVDMEARRWLMGRMEEEEMATRMDGVANVIGRYGPADGPAVVIGSHTDTVPNGGMFDGALGVLAGLECIRVIRENGIELAHPVEVISTSEEEGRFGGMLGAQALAGDLTPDWIESAQTAEGESLLDAFKAQNLDVAGAIRSARRPGDIRAFLELHIEQGPVLEAENTSIGVVDGISGVFKWMVRLIGKADHAGTAPMNLRSDAFMGLADFAHEISRIIEEEGTDRSRLTIGKVDLKPGFAHTVPGEVDFTIVGRDTDEEVMQQLAAACQRVLSAIARRHRLKFEYEERSWLAPQNCDPDVIEAFSRSCDELGIDYRVMDSGAGHDVQFFARIAPSGLIFVPSVNGVSHAPDEWTHRHDIENGANVLLQTLLHFAR